jgi:hypothetical protein
VREAIHHTSTVGVTRKRAHYGRFVRCTQLAFLRLRPSSQNDCDRRPRNTAGIGVSNYLPSNRLSQREARCRSVGVEYRAWADIDFAANVIHWRAESDKVRKDWRVPMPDTLREELQAFRVRMGGAFGGLLFPSVQDREVPLRRDVLSKWLLLAEGKAGLPKLDGSVWHCYRRAWATSRKALPVADVAAAGRMVGRRDLTPVLSAAGRRDHARSDVVSRARSRAKRGMIRGETYPQTYPCIC